MRNDYRKVSSKNMIGREEKTSFGYKMYKDGKKLVFAGIVGFSLIGFGVVAQADELPAASVNTEVSATPVSGAVDTNSAAVSDVAPINVDSNTADVVVNPTSESLVKPEVLLSDSAQVEEITTPIVPASTVAEPVAQSAQSTESAAADQIDPNAAVTTTTQQGVQAGVNDLNAMRAATRNYPYQYEDPGNSLPAVQVNGDLNAWAQVRANELSAIGKLSHADLANGRPGWVTPQNLLDAPNYIDGTIAHGPEALYMQITTKSNGSFVAKGEADAMKAAIDFWTEEANNNYDNAGHYLTEVSPLASIAGFAYSYNPATGAEIIVMELGYVKPETHYAPATSQPVGHVNGRTVAPVAHVFNGSQPVGSVSSIQSDTSYAAASQNGIAQGVGLPGILTSVADQLVGDEVVGESGVVANDAQVGIVGGVAEGQTDNQATDSKGGTQVISTNPASTATHKSATQDSQRRGQIMTIVVMVTVAVVAALGSALGLKKKTDDQD